MSLVSDDLRLIAENEAPLVKELEPVVDQADRIVHKLLRETGMADPMDDPARLEEKADIIKASGTNLPKITILPARPAEGADFSSFIVHGFGPTNADHYMAAQLRRTYEEARFRFNDD